MLRFSLFSLMLILVYASISCAALVNGTVLWAQVTISMTVVGLVLLTLAAAFRQGASQVFATGAAITGWIYFLLIFTSALNVRGNLLTDTAVQFLFTTIHAQPAGAVPVTYSFRSATPAGPFVTQQVVYTMPNPPSKTQPAPPLPKLLPAAPPPAVPAAAYQAPRPWPVAGPMVNPHLFGNIAHSIWAVILACCGGALAQVLAKRRQAGGAEPATPE